MDNFVPRRIRDSATWDPIKPAPPVSRIRFGFDPTQSRPDFVKNRKIDSSAQPPRSSCWQTGPPPKVDHANTHCEPVLLSNMLPGFPEGFRAARANISS